MWVLMGKGVSLYILDHIYQALRSVWARKADGSMVWGCVSAGICSVICSVFLLSIRKIINILCAAPWLGDLKTIWSENRILREMYVCKCQR